MKDHPSSSGKDLIFGIRPVMEAIHAGREVERLFIRDGISGPQVAGLRTLMRERGIDASFVPVEKLNRLVRGNHQGVVAFISPVSYTSAEDIVPAVFEKGKTPLFLILDRITDVRNFGAIVRTAECAGVDAIVVPSRGSAQINADAVKTSAGALHHIPLCREQNLKDTIDYLKGSGIQIAACTEKASLPFYEADFRGPTAFIMGSEENGVSPEYLKRADVKISIPMMGSIGSLNVSVATGIFLFEALRQRSVRP